MNINIKKLTIALILLGLLLAILAIVNNRLKPTNVQSASGNNSKQKLSFPVDTRIIVNVKDFGARGNGKIDDTEAIQKAIVWALENAPSHYEASPFIYFPQGTYLVTDELQTRIPSEIEKWSDGWRAGISFVGENSSQTIVRLADSATGYNDLNSPKAIIKTGSESDSENNPDGTGNLAVGHSIINLTLDTGRENPGAIGIDYLANNRGVIENVTIRSRDDQGVAGISMMRSWPGPALVKQVNIEGFDYGIKIDHFNYSMTLEHISLTSQNVAGIFDRTNTLAIRQLTSINSVPALEIVGDHAHVTLIDSQLKEGQKDRAAITSEGKMLLRNVEISGYGQAIDATDDSKDLKIPQESNLIEQYATDIVTSANSPALTLNLAIKETPTFHTNNFDKWANVEDFGATADDDSDDDSFAIQSAIDSGAEIVYFPNGKYQVEKTITLRGAVKKVMGMESSLLLKPELAKVQPLIRFDGGDTSEATIIEHLHLNVNNYNENIVPVSIEHNSPKTLVVRHCYVGANAYTNTINGTGDVFWENVMGKGIVINHPQNFWARQLNAEFGEEPLIENHGGNLWILGMATKGEMTVIETFSGKTELLGSHINVVGEVSSETPMFVNDRGQVSLSWSEGPNTYNQKVKERHHEDWNSLNQDTLSKKVSHPFTRIPLYTGGIQ